MALLQHSMQLSARPTHLAPCGKLPDKCLTHFRVPTLPHHPRGQIRRHSPLAAGSGPLGDDVLAKYGTGSSLPAFLSSTGSPGVPSRSSKPSPPSAPTSSPLHLSLGASALILANVAAFAAATLGRSPAVRALAMGGAGGGAVKWWQYASSAFAHAHWQQLVVLSFLLAVFGSELHQTLGSAGLVFAYVLGAIGANVAAYWFLPGLPAKSAAATALIGVGPAGGVACVALSALALSIRPSLGWLMGAASSAAALLLLLVAGAGAPGALVPGGSMAFRPSVLGGASIELSWRALKAASLQPAVFWLAGAAAAAVIVVLIAKIPAEDNDSGGKNSSNSRRPDTRMPPLRG